jgi:hypothetical protein
LFLELLEMMLEKAGRGGVRLACEALKEDLGVGWMSI